MGDPRLFENITVGIALPAAWEEKVGSYAGADHSSQPTVTARITGRVRNATTGGIAWGQWMVEQLC